jgi:orotidine-5'-phosphate decarboxylase
MKQNPGALPRAVPRRERLIAALDVPSAAEARRLVETLGEAVAFYKIGLELSTSGEYYALLDWLVKRGKRVFCDLKLYDIPETVSRAVANLRGRGVTFLTVHADRGVLRAAAKEKGEIQVLGVTVLTSASQADLAEQGYPGTMDDLVSKRAAMVAESGCDGVITSGLEVAKIKSEFGSRLLAVTPGIRPAGGDLADQKRVVDVAQAFRSGADYIVVGRPIRDAKDPAAAALGMQKTIAEVFSS